ncbi:hypothetical protein ACIBEJ_47705 [Nonomuraea sp. NPDC050790]|uniref:hypothetical protein n=1 Tax=Nonomuraea sp. NPDC050790 TaxID=3364371 RepID=UPI0037BCD4B7
MLSQVIDQLHRTGAYPTPSQSPTEEIMPFAIPIFCQDYRLPVRDYPAWRAHLRRQAEIAPDMRYSSMAVTLTALCMGQPEPVQNPQRPLKVSTKTPLLAVNSLHDPAAVYPWAVNVTREPAPTTFSAETGWLAARDT